MGNELQFFVKPGVEQYHHRMEQVKNMVQNALDIALVDFLMVSSVFKKYNQFLDPTMSGDDVNRVSMSVRELQYMDIFSQKLNHILFLNEKIKQSPINSGGDLGKLSDHAGFVFKLNHMQAVVAIDEFVVNVNDLKKNLHELHDHIISVTKQDFHESDYFKNLREIEEKLIDLIKTLDEIQKERYREAPISVGVIEKEVRMISDLYTMSSERFVLLWLLKHTEASVNELLEQYKQDGFLQVEEEIEMF